MARTNAGDEYDVAALRAELEALRAENTQERAEIGMLRAQVERFEATARETEAQKQAFQKFLDWVALSAEQKTQLEADRRYAGQLGDIWEVQLQEHPKVRLPAASEYDAVGKYQELCGITGTAHKFSTTRVGSTA